MLQSRSGGLGVVVVSMVVPFLMLVGAAWRRREANPENGQSLGVALLQRFQGGHVIQAGGRAGAPKGEQHVLAPELRELDAQSELLLPFEGLGVDAHWELRMPKAANPFDYSTVADVLITLEYTAVDRFDYRDQIIRTMRSRLSANRPFGFRYELADQWYDLHNPDQTATPMTIQFETTREDFPPNLDDLRIQHVTLYFSRGDGMMFQVTVNSLSFTAAGTTGSIGGSAHSIDGMINTRNGNAASWNSIIGKSPIGDWELAMPNRSDIRDLFKKENINDILFVITYSGRTPDWPA